MRATAGGRGLRSLRELADGSRVAWADLWGLADGLRGTCRRLSDDLWVAFGRLASESRAVSVN